MSLASRHLAIEGSLKVSDFPVDLVDLVVPLLVTRSGDLGCRIGSRFLGSTDLW